MTEQISTWLSDRGPRVLMAFAVLTAIFALANVALDDDTEASQEPDAAVFDARDDIDRRLSPLTHSQFVLVESADGGDLLRAEPLAELVANGNALRAADQDGLLAPDDIEAQPLLANRFDRNVGAPVNGFINLADVIANGVESQFDVPLSKATDDMVKVVLAAILSQPETAGLADQISVQATQEERTLFGRQVTVVSAPALVFEVKAWNAPLGGGTFAIGPSADPIVHRKEAFNLAVEDYVRGEQEHISVLAVAAAANETSKAQGNTAAPFIILAAIAAVLVVGIALRSYWATALTGVGLAILMTWLGGISNLIGLKGGLVIELLVPISMIALGVDFAVHSMAHYQHERTHRPRAAFRIGMGSLLGALALAAATDSAAFLSNASSDIEAIVDFALAAAVGTISSFIVLGIMAPLALSIIEEHVGANPKIGRFARSTQMATVRVAIMAGVASIVTLAVSPLIGAIITVGITIMNIFVPFRYARRNPTAPDATPESVGTTGTVAKRIGDIVVGLAARPALLLITVAALTGTAIYGAVGLQGSFNVSDFFAGDTDFVQSVERLPEHVGSRSGEPNQILIEGDLTNPAAWDDIAAFVGELNDNTALARNDDGSVEMTDPQPLEVLALLTADAEAVQTTTGVRPVDADDNGVPDSAQGVEAVWVHALANGVTTNDGASLFSPAEIATIIDLDPSGDATLVQVQVPDPSDFDNLKLAKKELAADQATLEDAPLIEQATATGSGLGRLEVIDASTDALKTSLPIAVVVVFLVLLLGLRSLRYAVVTTIPMMLVAAWLYGTMALLNFELNFVTATIGAISIGVGADYAIHMTQRYRTERRKTDNHLDAVRAAAESTGIALLASAGSTAVGFAILAFAPMPLFATFGLLTALMVTFALLASLIVLPTLLGLVTPDDADSLQADGHDVEAATGAAAAAPAA